MSKIRLLVVDDAAFIRLALNKLLSADPELEVVATAANGRIALDKLQQCQPDAVILDIEMPEMNGLETLAALRSTHPKLPVVMFSTLTKSGARATVDALLLGANDYATKPGTQADVNHEIRDVLIPKIKLHALPSVATESVRPAAATPTDSSARLQQVPPFVKATPTPARHAEVVAIASSTGGPNALAQLLADLPEDLSAAILIAQHMPPIFTKQLAFRLSSRGNIIIREGELDRLVVPGEGWIAPGDFHMIVEQRRGGVRLRLNQDPPEHSCRPAADVLFASVAKVYGPAGLGVVLTGMGKDGHQGCRHIHDAGGQILVQDRASSVVWGMPGSVAEAGLADGVFPLDRLGAEITRRVSMKKPKC